jgi:RNA polymerase sigma-70 factor (family 1)
VNYKEANDQDLLQHCRQDDMLAYNELFRRHSARLYKQAARYIPDDNIAEELMLDLLFDVWDKRYQRNIEGELSAYLYRCMRNKIIDYRRKALRINMPIEETALAENLTEQKHTDYKLLAAEAEEVYRLALAGMPPQRRRVFQLSREENLTYAEIAREMNLSINTVENYMVSALATFRTLTKEYLSVANKILFVIVIANILGSSLA